MSTLHELQLAATRPKEVYGEDVKIVCDNLVRIYQTDGVEVRALQGLDLLVRAGELVAVVGASGSGKSTLLNILSGLDTPTAGVARVGGYDLLTMKGRDRLKYRRETVGFIWQQTARNLLPYLSATDNVTLPMGFAGKQRKFARRRADELLDLLGVAYCADRRPGQMSGGEQQRCRSRSRWRTTPTWCSPTSRPASWTAPRRIWSSKRCGPRTPSSSTSSPPRPGTRPRRPAPPVLVTEAPPSRPQLVL